MAGGRRARIIIAVQHMRKAVTQHGLGEAARLVLELGKFIDEVRRAERVRGRDYDWLEARLADVIRPKHRHWGWKGRGGNSRDFPRMGQ